MNIRPKCIVLRVEYIILLRLYPRASVVRCLVQLVGDSATLRLIRLSVLTSANIAIVTKSGVLPLNGISVLCVVATTCVLLEVRIPITYMFKLVVVVIVRVVAPGTLRNPRLRKTLKLCRRSLCINRGLNNANTLPLIPR